MLSKVFGLLVGAIGFFSFDSSSVFATLFVRPSNGGSIGSWVATTVDGPKTFYYFVQVKGVPAQPTYSTHQTFILPQQFTPLDLAASAATRSQLQDMFEISVYSDEVLQGAQGQTPVLSFAAYPLTGLFHPAPIAAVNGVPCSEPQSGCLGFNQQPGTDHYFAALYPGTGEVLRIGFYPNDLCADAHVLGVNLNGCSSTGSIEMPTSGSPVTVQLAFSLGYSADGVSGPTPETAGAVEQMSLPLSLSFQVDIPELVCPSPAAVAYLYPGDGSIFLNTSLFGTTRAANTAPPARVWIVGQDQASVPGVLPVVDETFSSANTLVTSAALSPSERISGFVNSTSTQLHSYVLSFLVQDYTGLIAAPVSGSCLIQPVEVASIRGFLSDRKGFLGDGKCFIATAAFASTEALPLSWLRTFRDQILMSSSWGRQWVSSYYQWSPIWADRILRYPFLRLPVLLALLPLECAAWCFLQLQQIQQLGPILGDWGILGILGSILVYWIAIIFCLGHLVSNLLGRFSACFLVLCVNSFWTVYRRVGPHSKGYSADPLRKSGMKMNHQRSSKKSSGFTQGSKISEDSEILEVVDA